MPTRLASLAESEPLSCVKPILVSCMQDGAGRAPQEGQSRVKKINRVNVLVTKAIQINPGWMMWASKWRMRTT